MMEGRPMKKTSALILAAAIAFTATANVAHAKGGGGDREAALEALQAELAKKRANSTNDCANATVWEMLFGHDEAVAEADTPAVSVSQ